MGVDAAEVGELACFVGSELDCVLFSSLNGFGFDVEFWDGEIVWVFAGIFEGDFCGFAFFEIHGCWHEFKFVSFDGDFLACGHGSGGGGLLHHCGRLGGSGC